MPSRTRPATLAEILAAAGSISGSVALSPRGLHSARLAPLAPQKAVSDGRPSPTPEAQR